MNVFELTRALVNIPSVTGCESEIGGFLANHLKERGFAVREQEVEKGRNNIFADTGPDPDVILCTHMDTVPEFYGASEDETHIYGRGACDAKGIMASMILAASELKTEKAADTGLLFVVGEETDSIGARAACAERRTSRFIIVGEPTENKLGAKHKGIVTLTIKAGGHMAHSALTRPGESAVETLLDFVQAIRNMDFDRSPVRDKTTVNIGMIEGGLAPNVIADTAEAKVTLRTFASSRGILDEIFKLKSEAFPRIEIGVLTCSEPQNLFTLPGFETAVLPYGTDIPYLRSFGRPLLVGPGSIADAHVKNEKVAKRQLEDGVHMYKRLVTRLLDPGSR